MPITNKKEHQIVSYKIVAIRTRGGMYYKVGQKNVSYITSATIDTTLHLHGYEVYYNGDEELIRLKCGKGKRFRFIMVDNTEYMEAERGETTIYTEKEDYKENVI